jgi:15-cis-phytoene synthase
MTQLFNEVSYKCSRITTHCYSTSFSSAIKLLDKSIQQDIHNIYGFVRFADEIVDTFHEYDKSLLLEEFENQTFDAIERGISLNPILQSFQLTVNSYKIESSLIHSFFQSMQYDLDKKKYDADAFNQYIYGSAESIGLMCLKVFCKDDLRLYEKLSSYARSLGAAFQKVNFLRDAKKDFENLDRIYFPQCDFLNFTCADKASIENDIQKDFDEAYKGIFQLPATARTGVYVAYKYYLSLFKKIRKTKPHNIMQKRIRIPNYSKAFILFKASVRMQLNML